MPLVARVSAFGIKRTCRFTAKCPLMTQADTPYRQMSAFAAGQYSHVGYRGCLAPRLVHRNGSAVPIRLVTYAYPVPVSGSAKAKTRAPDVERPEGDRGALGQAAKPSESWICPSRSRHANQMPVELRGPSALPAFFRTQFQFSTAGGKPHRPELGGGADTAGRRYFKVTRINAFPIMTYRGAGIC